MFHHHCDDDSIEEPPFQYTATEEALSSAASGKDKVSKRISMEPINSLLDISMNLLQEGLESESLIAQFEVKMI